MYFKRNNNLIMGKFLNLITFVNLKTHRVVQFSANIGYFLC